MMKGSTIKSKAVMLLAIVMLAIAHAYAMYDVWSYNYNDLPDFLIEYSLVGIPFAFMFLRLLAANNTNVLNIWLFIVLSISAFFCIFGILGSLPDKAVWMLAIDIIVLFVGAFVSLLMGWRPTENRKSIGGK